MLIKKYFIRPQHPRGLKLQPYDYRALALLDEYRFLDSRMLWELLKLWHPQLTWDTAKHRLHALWSNGFIERPPEQLSILIKQDRFHLIMCLSERGARVVAEHYGRDLQQTTWRVNQERANFRLLEHQLAISRFRAAVQLSQSLEILVWLHDRQFHRNVAFRVDTEHQQRLFDAHSIGERISRKVEPDSLFVFRANGATHAAAVEIDQGSASVKALARKFAAYYKTLQAISQQPVTVGGHPLSHFWVLTVSPGETHYERPGVRVGHLQESVRAISERDRGPLHGHRSFLFTTADQFSWEQPTSILEPIWQTPNEGERYSLLTLPATERTRQPAKA